MKTYRCHFSQQGQSPAREKAVRQASSYTTLPCHWRGRWEPRVSQASVFRRFPALDSFQNACLNSGPQISLLLGQRSGNSAAHPSRTAQCSYSQLCSPAQICRDCAHAEEPRGCAQQALLTSQLLLPLMRRALIQYVKVKPQNIFCFVLFPGHVIKKSTAIPQTEYLNPNIFKVG